MHNEQNNLYISCSDKHLLSSVVMSLRKTQEQVKKANAPQQIVVNANNNQSSNIVVGSNNTFNNSANITETYLGKKSFWKSVWEGITQRIVWVAIVAIILIVLALLNITQPGWLKL